MAAPENITVAQRNLIQALDYLLYLDKLRTKPIIRLAEHKLPIFHEADFSGLPGIATGLIEGDAEVWLSVRRLRAESPPQLHAWLLPWVSLPNDPTKPPSIAERIELDRDKAPPETIGPRPLLPVPTGALKRSHETAQLELFNALENAPPQPELPSGRVELRLEDVPEIGIRFREYIREEWEPWSLTEKPRRQSIRIYDRLFSLLQDAEFGGGADGGIEIAWGVGFALWDHQESGETITYPLITRTVEIHVDERSMAIIVTPTERDPVIHVDGFEELGILQASLVESRARSEFAASEKTFSPADPDTFQGILRFAATHLDNQGVYWPDESSNPSDRSLPSICSHLTVTDTWVIFARKRTTNFIAADIEKLKEAVNQTDLLPSAPALIVTEPADQAPTRQRSRYRGLSTSGVFDGSENSGADGGTSDLFFPKPFNAEQIVIIERLDQSAGVVVQGPPGTGKTHTIANIICHYLALGKRVLVTSQHEAPLAVLQAQIPESIRPLTIALLTSERDGLKQLEQAVRKIAGEVYRLDERELDRDIRSETERIERLHQKLAALDHDLHAWAARQTAEAPFFGGGALPGDIARHVVESEQAHIWFPDRLAGDDTSLPTFQEADIRELRLARRLLGPDLCYFGHSVPTPEQLPLPEDIAKLHRDLLRFDTVQEAVITGGKVPHLRQYTTESIIALSALRESVINAQLHLRAASGADWAFRARPLFRKPTSYPVTEHLKRWVKDTMKIEEARQTLIGDAIEIPNEAQLNSAVYQAVERAANGKKPFPLFGGDRVAKALLAQIRYRASGPCAPEDWQRVLIYLNTARKAEALSVTWEQLRHEFDGPAVSGTGLATVRVLHQHARAAVALWVLDDRLAEPLRASVDALFADVSTFGIVTESLDQLERLLTAIDAHLEHSRLKAAASSRRQLELTLAGCGGPIAADVDRFLKESLGCAGTPTEQVMEQWRHLLEEFARLAALAGHLGAVLAVTRQMEDSGAREWARILRCDPANHNLDSWLPENWRAAWEWSRARGYLEAIDGREEITRLSRERNDAESELREAYSRAIELRTWSKLKANMTPKISAALAAYLAAVTRIGAGTGIRATRFRRDAREAMSKAYGATPCWIMAHWRVSEALPPQLGLFDLVIIDEASQSDIWALPAIVRAKKLLIVGDDKQVSPSDIGVRESDTNSLRLRFLNNLPYGQHFLPGSSIYDLGSTMFASDIIRLREHFRCVEPIIAFSNRQFYDSEIKPLRIPTPSERLDPPLVDVYVRGGYRQGKTKIINKPEANAVVEEIRRLSEEGTIGERSIGVVSLLGSEQAKYIQDRLLETLGEERFLRHRIRCGDAMHFQGKEADIVMISMVAAGTITAATGRMYEQRYNVACSRARDRMYVFHSFTRDEVTDVDLRARLLDHLAHPLGESSPVDQELRALCESDFEREVFDELAQRGYPVVPQVRVGGFRIDLVVEGADDRRLAIECDGDRYHGIDRWMDDMSRQRILERMGWRFWRCWASSWITQRDVCLVDLIEALNTRGIEPWKDEDGSRRSVLVEYRTIEPDKADSPAPIEQYEQDELVAPENADAGAAAPDDVALLVDAAIPSIEVLDKGRGVELNDIVDYVRESAPDDILRVTVVSGHSEPGFGIVNEHTPLGNALLGAEVGELVEAHLPQGITQFRIVGVQPRKLH